jgi:hypothetical protein
VADSTSGQKPLEINDFSGGITDNYLQSDPRRSQIIQNFFITVDKKLEERYPFVAYSNSLYQVGANYQRVNGMFALTNETILMAASARTLYYLPPISQSLAAQQIIGVGGNEAIQGGDVNSQISYGEFQKQIYFTSDGTLGQNGCIPSKVFQNSTGAWTAVTAGLPRAYGTPNYTTASLLAACIANANQLRTSFISHMNDALNVVYKSNAFSAPFSYSPNFLHYSVDQYSLSFLQAYTFTTADPEGAPPSNPTPAPAATDQPSLFTLVYALNQAFTHHCLDALAGLNGNTSNIFFNAQGGATSQIPAYHYPTAVYGGESGAATRYPPRGPHVSLTNAAKPTTLIQAATQLDDLFQKWNWHRKAVWTHSIYNDPTMFDRYAPTNAKIGTVQTSATIPTVTPDFTDLFNYVNNIKALFNTHVLSTAAHKAASNVAWWYDLFIRLPNATDLDSMYLMIFWLRSMYYLHYLDASVTTHVGVTYNIAQNAASLTGMLRVTGGTAYPVSSTAAFGSVYLPYVLFTPGFAGWQAMQGFNTSSTFAVGTGSGTASSCSDFNPTSPTIGDRLWTSATVTGNADTGYISKSLYHVSYNPTTAAYVDSTASNEQVTDALSTSLYTYGTEQLSWLTLALDMYNAFSNHVLYQNVHVNGYVPATANASAYQALLSVSSPNASSFTPNYFFIPAVGSYQYAFFFSYQYNVGIGGVQYTNSGNPVFSASIEGAVSYPVGYLLPSQFGTFYNASYIQTTRGNVLSNLPVLTNTGETNYDTANVMLNIARTTSGGSTFFLVAQVPNGTTSYTDFLSDTLTVNGITALSTQSSIYTTGGNVGSDQPPQCKYMCILNGVAYYGALTVAGQYFPNRYLQSVQLAPDWAPQTFVDDLDDAITGINSTRPNIVIGCQNSLYTVIGGFTQTAQGSLSHNRISDTTGVLNQKSMVRTEIGLFFAGNDGFYYTDAFQIIKISIDQDKTYAALTASLAQKRAIYGAYDKVTRRIWWSMRANANDADNSVIYVYYLNYGVKPSGVFTTIANPGTFVPSSLVFQQGVPYIGHGSGFILKGDVNNKYDYLPVEGSAPSAWTPTAIPYNWTSSAVDFGTSFMRKWLTQVHFVGKNIGNTSSVPSAIKDLNQTGVNGTQPMSAINYNVNIWWGMPAIVWGSKIRWTLDGKMDLFRWIPTKVMQSDFMQVQYIPNANAVVYSSSQDYPYGCFTAVNSTLKTATIITPAGYSAIYWPPEIVGNYVTFQYSGYTNQYLITAVSNATLTYADAGNTSLTATTTAWQIMGLKKQQRASLVSVDIHYNYVGQNNQSPGGSYSSGGPGNLGGNPS